jgi:hypothetical protein
MGARGMQLRSWLAEHCSAASGCANGRGDAFLPMSHVGDWGGWQRPSAQVQLNRSSCPFWVRHPTPAWKNTLPPPPPPHTHTPHPTPPTTTPPAQPNTHLAKHLGVLILPVAEVLLKGAALLIRAIALLPGGLQDAQPAPNTNSSRGQAPGQPPGRRGSASGRVCTCCWCRPATHPQDSSTGPAA